MKIFAFCGDLLFLFYVCSDHLRRGFRGRAVRVSRSISLRSAVSVAIKRLIRFGDVRHSPLMEWPMLSGVSCSRLKRLPPSVVRSRSFAAWSCSCNSWLVARSAARGDGRRAAFGSGGGRSDFFHCLYTADVESHSRFFFSGTDTHHLRTSASWRRSSPRNDTIALFMGPPSR